MFDVYNISILSQEDKQVKQQTWVNSQQGKTSGLLEYTDKLYPIFNKLDVNDPYSFFIKQMAMDSQDNSKIPLLS